MSNTIIDQADNGIRNSANFRYHAFGLSIASDVPLPELAIDDRSCRSDILIRYHSTGRPLPQKDLGYICELFNDDCHYIAWPEVGAFRIHGNGVIDVEPHQDVPISYLPFPILGPIMGFLLHLRGYLVLHASAVEIEGKSVVFVGDKGAGKSTTAAAFVQQGYRLLTDDLLAIDMSGTRPIIHPAFGQLKLSPEASATIALPKSQPIPRPFPELEKQQHRLLGSFSQETVGVDHIFVLDRSGDAPHFELLSGIDPWRAAMRFSYVVRFGRDALPGVSQVEHARRCAEITKTAAIYRLKVPADLSRINEVISLVESLVKTQ